MNDYWGIPEREFQLSLLQFAGEELNRMGYSVLDEKVEVCGGAGALTVTAIIKSKEKVFGLYLHDGPKQRKTRGPPVIRVLGLLPEMTTVEDLRHFVITHQHDFFITLAPDNTLFKDRTEAELTKIYTYLYDLKIKDLYDTDLSSAADVLRIRLRKEELVS
jgi:hypothetical protein